MTHPSIYPSIAHPILAYVVDKKDTVLLFFSNDDDDDLILFTTCDGMPPIPCIFITNLMLE